MIIIADNLQITDPAVARSIEERNPEFIEKLVRSCEAAGADAMDINPGPSKKDAAAIMRFLVETVQNTTAKPILLDTTSAAAIEAGLIASKNKTIINGFSLEPSKCADILPLAKRFDTDIIGYLLYPDSRVPTDQDEFFSIALELISEIEKAGIGKDKLIIDPVVAPLIWENGKAHNRSLLVFISRLHELVGFPIRTVAGLSNLTTGSAAREKKRLAERTFLPMMAASGLDMVLMQVFHTQTMHTAKACNALTGEDIFSWAMLG
jgi:5-methyltetrahydrofolate corrinoid/iron sulfur protein methyltransferase